MNHRAIAHRKPGKRQPLNPMGKRRRKRRSLAQTIRQRRYRKPNHWHQNSDLVYSKIVIRDCEILWLQELAPMATVTLEYVQGYTFMPEYRSGQWDGQAFFVRFPKEAQDDATSFRLTWWNQRA